SRPGFSLFGSPVHPPFWLMTVKTGRWCRMAVSNSIAFIPKEPSPCDHLLIGLGDLRAGTEKHADAHGSECTRIDAGPRRELWDRLAAVVEDLLAIDAQDAIAVHEVTDLLAQPQRVNRRLGRGELLLGLRHLLHVADAQAFAP